jgi:hypothetical protein
MGGYAVTELALDDHRKKLLDAVRHDDEKLI